MQSKFRYFRLSTFRAAPHNCKKNIKTRRYVFRSWNVQLDSHDIPILCKTKT